MFKEIDRKLTLYQPATYRIKVPGQLDESWSDWIEGMTITVDHEGDEIGRGTGTFMRSRIALSSLPGYASSTE